jgi:hypothetical protein
MRMTCAILVLLLAGCGKADNAPGPGGVTVGEARALDEAAAMLDKRRPPEDILEPPANASAQPEAAQAPLATATPG